MFTEKDFTFKTKPLKHQIEALKRSCNKANFAYLMEMGCVDGETEFLSNRGWIKFKDFDINKWEKPLLVAQVSETDVEEQTHVSFAQPISYINKEVPEIYSFFANASYSRNNKRPGLEITVSPEHNMRCRLKTWNGEILHHIDDDITAEQLIHHLKPIDTIKRQSLDCTHAQVLQCCTKYTGIKEQLHKIDIPDLVSLNEWELRLLVAIMADGNFPHKYDNRCQMEFRKPEKIERFEKLCIKAGVVAVREIIRGGLATRFNLIAPARKKIYDNDFWFLSPEQMDIIFDEVFFWDGSMESTRFRFYTIHKQSADFIQFLCATHGYKTSIITTTSNNAPYYTVQFNPNKCILEESLLSESYCNLVGYEKKKGGQVYCFRMPSGQLLLRRNNKIFVTGNSGKTKVIIDNMAFLKKKGVINGALVLAPKGVYRNWSTVEIPKHMPDETNYEILVWRAEATTAAKTRLKDQIKNWNGQTFQILVFNIESLLSDGGMQIIDLFIKAHKYKLMGVIDESTCIKNHKAKRTKKAIQIGQSCKVKRIATGSPITNSPLDLYSQFAFLNKAILGCGSYYAFRNVYAEFQKIPTRTGQYFDKLLKYKNLDELSRRIADFSYRITKRECLDLPDKIYMTREVELTKEQITLYNQMKQLSFTQYEDEIMSVQIALTKLLRLHQILCGSFTTDTGEHKQVPNNRLKVLEETLEECGNKTIIWANYLQNISDIKELLTSKYGAESFITYTGAVSSEDRLEAIKLFQNMNSPVRFFLGNVQTAGRGITLTAAQTVIYFSNNYSLEMRQQSEDRAHRVGQKNPVTYIDLVARGTLDEKIIQALLAKRNIANEILHDDLESWITL